jgi:hypothetical protein
MKRLLMVLLLAGLLGAQVAGPLAAVDITGDSASHRIQTSGYAQWVIISTPSTNSAVVRIGGSTVSSTRGIPVAPGGSLMFPPLPADPRQATADRTYNLAGIYYLAGTGDKLSVMWVK